MKQRVIAYPSSVETTANVDLSAANGDHVMSIRLIYNVNPS